MAIDTNSKVTVACPMSILKVAVLDFKLLHKEDKRSSKALKNSNRKKSQSSWKKKTEKWLGITQFGVMF